MGVKKNGLCVCVVCLWCLWDDFELDLNINAIDEVKGQIGERSHRIGIIMMQYNYLLISDSKMASKLVMKCREEVLS